MQCADCSEADMATASETRGPLQEAARAADAPLQHQPPTLCRLSAFSKGVTLLDNFAAWPIIDMTVFPVVLGDCL